MKLTRITVHPEQMGGVPCLRSLRIPVATVVGMVADGMTNDEILKAYPDLERMTFARHWHPWRIERNSSKVGRAIPAR